MGVLHQEAVLQRLIERLERVETDPKMRAIEHYLDTEMWLSHGVIILSQYYDTALWVAQNLAAKYPDLPVVLYAGDSRSKLFEEGKSGNAER